MQCGLVDDGDPEGGGAVALVGEARDLEPGRPSGTEVAPEADLVEPDLSLAASAGRCLAHRAARCSTRLVAGAASGAALRWSRHREMPRPIRATPVGTAIGRLNDCGSTLSATVATVPTARRAAAHRARTRARNSAMPKRRPPDHVREARDVEEGLHPADAAGRRATEGSDHHVVHVAGRRVRQAGEDERGDDLGAEHERGSRRRTPGSRPARARVSGGPDAGTCR